MKDDRREWDKMMRRLDKLGRLEITVGVHGKDAQRDDGESNVAVAATHEFGAPHRSPPIPERSFLRSTFDSQREDILDDMATVADKALQGSSPIREARILGIETAERVRETIRQGISPALRPMTLERRKAKGSKGENETPLIDTGQLIQSIQSEVTS